MNKTRVLLAGLIAVSISILGIGLLPKPAVAQGFPPAYGGSVPLFTNVAALGSTTSLTNTDNAGAKRPITVPVNSRLAVMLTYSGGQAGTSNLIFGFNGALNNDQWTTDFPITGTVALTGTATNTVRVLVATNLGFRFLSLDRWQNFQTNNVTIHNMTYTFFSP